MQVGIWHTISVERNGREIMLSDEMAENKQIVFYLSSGRNLMTL